MKEFDIYRKEKIWCWIGIIIMFMIWTCVFIIAVSITGGCIGTHTNPNIHDVNNITTPPHTYIPPEIKTLYKTDWLTTFASLAALGGIIGLVFGHSWGIKLLAAGIATFTLISALTRYSKSIAFIGMIGILILAGFVLWRLWLALKEIIKNVQDFKINSAPTEISNFLKQQSKSTQNLVKNIKKNLEPIKKNRELIDVKK
jgi:hypothetical protein